MKSIKFYTTEDCFSSIPNPEPAIKFLPDWYKDMNTKIDEASCIHKTNKTMKMCFGVVDSFSYGYIIPSFCDMNLYWENNNLKVETSWEKNFISAFPESQFKDYELPNGHVRSMIKITLPWRIETSKGTSILVAKPKWRNVNFEIYEGIVDSDSYVNHIHVIISFDKNEKIIIKRGQPLVQIIPLVRDDWNSEIKVWSNKEELKFNRQQNTVHSYLFGGYKKHFWKQKKFK
jgi:hypothetical protein